MAKLLKIGIVGCGAIGSSLANSIVSDFSDQTELAALFDAKTEKAYNLSGKFKRKIATLNLEALIKKVGLVVEATSADSSFDIVKKTILASCDALIMSVGGVLKHYEELAVLAKEKNARIYIPSGAICGIDGLKAARCGKINKVVLTTKKPPQAFLGNPYLLKKKIRLDNLKRETVIFEGRASSAVIHFPQNINVAATLSLAGIGPQATVVRIVASPHLVQNIHEIEIESEAGRIITRAENAVHPDNPKTSYLAVLSAIATLKQILEPIKVGT